MHKSNPEADDLSNENLVRERLTAFVADELSEKLLQQCVSDLGLESASVYRGDINNAISHLENKRSPKALIIDISGVEPAVTKVNRLAEVCEPGVSVMAIGDRNDVPLFRDLLLAGIGDYLIKPLSKSLIDNAMRRLLGTANVVFKPLSQKLGEVVTVIGTRGGIGASTIATNLAWGLANKKYRRVALIDLNLAYGSCGLILDVKGEGGLREALERPQRVDELFLERAMIPVGDRLSLFSCRETFDEPIIVDPAALSHLIAMMRKEFHFVVLDVPRANNFLLEQSIQLSGTLIFIVDQTTLAIRDMLSIRSLISGSREGKRTLVVLNRFGELGKNAINSKQIETAIGLKIDAQVPFDPDNVVAASNAGVPLLTRRSAVSREIEAIANLLGGNLPAPAEPKWYNPFGRR